MDGSGSEPNDVESSHSKTARPPMEGGDSKQKRRRERGSVKSGGKGARRTEWQNGLFNLSFDDDCGYLALLFPSVVDTPPTISTDNDGVKSSTCDSGPSAAKKDSGKRTSEQVNERSRLAASATATYDGRSTEQLSDISRGGSPGVPEPTRDTRPLISDDDLVGRDGQESALRIVGEVLLPFLLAGLGSVFAGLILDLVQVRKHTCHPVSQTIEVGVAFAPVLRTLTSSVLSFRP